jgi:hypothetical protein
MPLRAPKPDVARTDVTYWKGIFAKPSLTSFYQCWFYPTEKSKSWIKERGLDFKSLEENISFLCSEASLPGSQLATNEILSDYTGVTERHPYRRQFDERMDFTFYVDHYGARGAGGSGNSHNIIWFFENWIQHVVDESIIPVGDRPSSEDGNYFYRVAFPTDYQTDIFINKFERDFTGTYLSYRFHKAYPISIASMPVSYDSSQILKCTVSFSFTRYTVNRYVYNIASQVRDNPLLNNLPATLNPLRRRVDENIVDTTRAVIDSVAGFLRY